jgi:hypothetical protein
MSAPLRRGLIPTGQWSPVTAYRKNLEGVIIAPALFMWNVENT